MEQIIDQIRSAYRFNSDPHMDKALLRLSRLLDVLETHRRYHAKVGCPGRPECSVCAEEEWAIDNWENTP